MTCIHDIDWSKQGDPKWITCRCGYVFQSRAVETMDGPERVIVSEKPCALCGRKIGQARAD